MSKYTPEIVSRICELIETDQYESFVNNDFENEKDLMEFIILNKELFCRNVLGFEYKSYETECAFKKIDHLHKNEPRVDIIFWDINNYVHLVELKSPRNEYGECMQGVGQCLAYYYLARVNGFNLGDVYLVTTKHCNLVPLIIRDARLNLKYIYFSKRNWTKSFK